MNTLIGCLAIAGWCWLILVVLDHLNNHTPHRHG